MRKSRSYSLPFSLMVLLAGLCLSAASCTRTEAAQSDRSPRNAGARAAEEPVAQRSVEQRMVSLDATATEWLYALGLGEQLVGRNAQSSHPAEALDLPDLGHHSQWSAEAILALEPDLVLVHRDQAALPVVDQLRTVGLEVAVLDRTPDPASAVAFVHQLGQALGREDLTAEHAERLKSALVERGLLEGEQNAKKQAHSATEATTPSVLFVYASSGGRVLVGGAHTPMHAILRLSGARNAAAAVQGYKPVSPEFLMTNPADVVLLFPHSLAALGGMEGLQKDPGLSAISAVGEGRVLVLDGLMLTGFGPRLPQAYDTLRAAWARFEPSSTGA